ncbi:MAG: protein kinase [Gammaproteobacteria bacterium]|nr:protein kinase [Gammaproteobacteria bacterium]
MEIPGYTIDREIGQGGMAVVYLATQQSLDRRVALKVIKPSLAADVEFAQRFLQEGRIVAQLVDPRIVTIYEVGSHGDLYFMAMEYLPGGTLAERMRSGLSLSESLNIARILAGALDVAHRQGFVHRDIKPHNILFREKGEPVLADFGLAKVLRGADLMAKAGISVGTPRYMSPEQIRGLTVDARSDWYSFGVVLYEMLSGQVPFAADDSFAMAFKQLAEPVPDLPVALARFQPLLDKLLAKDPQRRYASANEFIAALDEVVEQPEPPLGTPITGSDVVPSFPSSVVDTRRTVIALAGLFGLLVLGAYGLLLKPDMFKPNPAAFQAPVHADQAKALFDEQLRRVQEYLAAARKEYQQGDLESAKQRIAQGLQIMPDHPELLAIRASIQAMEEKRRQAEDFLVQAQQHYQAGDLKGSLQAVEAGLAQVPDHPELLQLQEDLTAQVAALQQEADQHLEQARFLLQTGDLDASLAEVDLGLVLVPDSPDLLALRQEIVTKQAPVVPPLTALLAECDAHFQADRLTGGAGNNAWACYREVLRQDPENAQARRGLRLIADRYAEWAELALRQDDWASAYAFLDRLEQVNPQAPQLIPLRAEAVRGERAAHAEAEARSRAEAEARSRAEAEARARLEAQQNRITTRSRAVEEALRSR